MIPRRPLLPTCIASIAIAALALATATPALAVIASPFVDPEPDPGGFDPDPGMGSPGDPGGTFSMDYLIWVVADAINSDYNGYTAVLVRGFEAVSMPGGTATHNPMPSVDFNQKTGKWELSGGLVHGIANLGEQTEFVAAGNLVTDNLNIDRFETGDFHVAAGVTGFIQSDTHGVALPNDIDGRWAEQVKRSPNNENASPVQDYNTAYPYYMFIFDTNGSGNIDNAGADAFIGMFYEELDSPNHDLPQIQNVPAGDFDALVVRFSGPFHAVPEPATAALFLLGIACLARRRR